MNHILAIVEQDIATNSGVYKAFAIAFALAAIRSMPLPGSSFSWRTLYGWVYETFQNVLPTPRPKPPTQPEGPAPTQK